MELNYSTKKAQGFIQAYNRSYATDLREVYTTFSAAKAKAEDYCLTECYNNNGYCFYIIGHNCMTFTCAYLVDNYEGKGKALIVHTSRNKYVIYIPEKEVI